MIPGVGDAVFKVATEVQLDRIEKKIDRLTQAVVELASVMRDEARSNAALMHGIASLFREDNGQEPMQ
jgi:hypothetical protein